MQQAFRSLEDIQFSTDVLILSKFYSYCLIMFYRLVLAQTFIREFRWQNPKIVTRKAETEARYTICIIYWIGTTSPTINQSSLDVNDISDEYCVLLLFSRDFVNITEKY
uniref:Uncharacterized protein n=1 Tax=Glossina brevipalpis TaxID=37001 RepID=A0A1A9WF22_9MUSC